MKINSITIEGDESLTVFTEGGNVEIDKAADNMVVLRVAKEIDPDPDPDPTPGDILASFSFEDGDYELWDKHPAFQKGRAKTHGEPVPEIVGSYDLRMKYDNRPMTGGGLFKPGERGVASQTFTVLPGARKLLLYGVAHDEGTFIVRVIDEDAPGRPVVLEEIGSAYWTPNAYLPKEFPFQLTGERATVEFDYTAPSLDKESGIKVGYGHIT